MGDFGSTGAGPMKRIVFLIVAVGLIALFGWWATGQEGSAEVLDSESQPETISGASVEHLQTTDLVGAPGDADQRAVVDVTDDDPKESQSAAESSIRKGRIVLIDEAGAEHSALSGQLTLMKWTDNRRSPDPVEVELGSFEFDATNVQRIGIEELILDGRHAKDVDEDPRHVLDENEIVLHVKWTPTFTLNVLDAESGIHLDQVRVLWVKRWASLGSDERPGRWTRRPYGRRPHSHPSRCRPPQSNRGAIPLSYSSPVRATPGSGSTSTWVKVVNVRSGWCLAVISSFT